MSKSNFYEHRQRILDRRAHLAPKLQSLLPAVEAYFAGYELDPLTTEPVFSVSSENTESYPEGIITVTFLAGQTMSIGLPAEGLNLVVEPKSLLDGTSGEISDLQDYMNGDWAFVTFVNSKTTGTSRLSTVLAEFTKRCFGAWA